jgi:large subunit ribosomal protein L6
MRGFKAYLLIKGLGFKLLKKGGSTIFKLGFSHNIVYFPPLNIEIHILPRKSKSLIIKGISYQFVNEIGSLIKRFRKPNAYKRQGIFSYKQKIGLKDPKKKN